MSMYIYLAARDATVAFTATRSKTFTSSIRKIVFNTVITNVGGAYSGTTGIFTSPSDGVYGYIWTLTTDDEEYCYVKLYKNGSEEDFRAYARLSGVTSDARSQSIMAANLRLNKGDRIWLQADDCSYFYGSPYNAFTGWKL